MLDQNTDRMWYVIGAVIIGAAIVLIMNTTFPTLFGTIGRTFENATKPSTEIVDGIGPIARDDGQNLNFNMAELIPWTSTLPYEKVANKAIKLTSNEAFKAGVFLPESYFQKEGTYVVSFDIQKLSGDINGLGGHLQLSDTTSVTIDGKTPNAWALGTTEGIALRNEWSRTVEYPNDTKKHSVRLSFIRTAEDAGKDGKVYIQPNRTNNTAGYALNGLSYEALIENVEVYYKK